MSLLRDLAEFGKYKVFGIMLVVLGLIGFLVYSLTRITQNEMKHTQAAVEKNTEVLSGVKEVLSSNNEVIRGNTTALNELKFMIIRNR